MSSVSAPAAAPGALPRWDMSVVYPGLDSPEFAEGFAAVVRGIVELERLFDAEGVGQREETPLEAGTVGAFERVLARFNAVLEEVETLGAYVYAFVATDSRDDLAQAKLSELQQHEVRLAKLGTRFTAWVGSLDVEALIGRSTAAADHAFPLRQAKREAAHLMSPAEEELAAELQPAGGTAWSKLYNNVASQILVRFERDGETRELPMSAIRNLAFESDREVRRRGYEAELAAWRTAAVPLAAAMNGIKGEVNALSARRGWETPLDAALFHSHIDRQTLDAMFAAAREAFPDLRRYLRAKARAIGLPALAWYDLFAPVGGGDRSWDWASGVEFILEQFGAYSDRMRAFADRAFRERWVDAEPRPGKRDGAFCMSLRGDESRILANYQASYDGVSTMAHELGHGYHNLNEAGLSPMQRQTPMTLAETASTFCETIVRQAALARADRAEQIAILEGALQDAAQIVIDITSRFLFEQRVFEARQQRDLSVEELNELMLQAQRETYGDGLDNDQLHPYMWAVKGHYYSSGVSFYNFPYMFGLLFGLGLYAQYEQEPDGFRRSYDDLLAWTGRADAAELAGRFGIDIRTPEFWRASLDVVRADVERFEELTTAE